MTTTSSDPYTACDACRIVDLLIMHNWTLSFSGDSMTRQTYAGFQCEIMRRISSEIINNNNTTSYRTKVMPWVKWPRERKNGWKYGIHDVQELHIYHANKSHNSNNYARILLFAMYRPLPDNNNTELEYIAGQSDIIVFDHGLHYLPDQFKEMIERTQTMLPALGGGGDGKVKLVAWRETSSQHFNTTHGEYIKHTNVTNCQPIRHAPDIFRSDIMIQAAKLANWTVQWANNPAFSTTSRPKGGGRGSGSVDELVIIPFRKFTHDLHYMHAGECTHYCSSPHLWLPIWRGLRLAMDRLFL
jgi:hypothetical protein